MKKTRDSVKKKKHATRDEDDVEHWEEERPTKKGRSVKQYVRIPLAEAKRRLLDHLGLQGS